MDQSVIGELAADFSETFVEYALKETGLTVRVDLTGYESGYYLLSPTIDTERWPGLTSESEAVSLTLSDISMEDGTVAD